MISNEESTVYSQAIHYANRIVYMRIPLDATKKVREPVSGMEGESLSSMVTNRWNICSILVHIFYLPCAVCTVCFAVCGSSLFSVTALKSLVSLNLVPLPVPVG